MFGWFITLWIMEATEKSDLWTGRRVGQQQRYRLDQPLGGGGMGDVYLAMDLTLGKQVALKVLKATLSDNNDLRKRFDREVTISAALGSEHIVQVLDHGVMREGYPFYVMEYLKGESLGQRVRREKRLSPEQVVRIMVQVCEGLALAHNGITLWRSDATYPEHIRVIHRDLKPDNIFLIPHNLLGDWVKILDFGIAKIYTEEMSHTTLTNVGSFLGTCRYAAPEQWRGDEIIDGRTDIYALGVLIYQILSGTDPFGLHSETRNINATSWLTAHAFTDPQPLRELPDCQRLPNTLEEVVLRCLAKEPQDRYPNVETLSLALKQAIGWESGGTAEEIRSDDPQLNPPLETTLPNHPLGSRKPQGQSEKIRLPVQAEPSPDQAQTRIEPVTTPQAGSHPPELDQATPVDTALTCTAIDRWKLPLAAVLMVGLGLGAVGIWSLTRGSDPLQQAQSMAEAGDRLSAISLAEGIPDSDTRFSMAQALISDWRVQEAREAASVGDLSSAIALASQVEPDQPNYSTAQALASEWTLEAARQAASAGDLAGAIAMAGKIPVEQASFAVAQSLLADWQLQQALAFLEQDDLDKARQRLGDIPTDQPQFEQGQALGQDLERVQSARTQARSGQFQTAIATAYGIRPEGEVGQTAQNLVCEQLAALLNKDFRMGVDAVPNGQPPRFGNYQLSGCTSPRIQIRSQILNLSDRSDDNLKLIAIAMASMMWENLPQAAHTRLQSGEIQVDFVQGEQQIAQVFISRPALFTDGGADLLNQMLASTQVQRP